MNALVEEKNHRLVVLPFTENQHFDGETTYDLWRGVSLVDEMKEMDSVLKLIDPRWLIVDHYGIPEEWEKFVSSKGIKVFAIDDLRRKHAAEILLDQNFEENQETYTGLVPHSTKVFLGPAFALLDPSYLRFQPRKRNFSLIERMLVFFGGMDSTGETLRVVKILEQLRIKIKYDIVVGKKNPNIEEIKKNITASELEMSLHIQTNDMPNLMNRADIYIGAGGTSTWERCCLHLPALCVAVADNQIIPAQNLHAFGAHRYIGDARKIKDEDYLLEIQKLLQDGRSLESLSEGCKRLHVAGRINELLDLLI